MAPELIGTVSYGLCALLFFGLFVKLLLQRHLSKTEQALTIAVLFTAVWACASTIMFYKDSVVFFGWVSWVEVSRNAAWFYCLLVVFNAIHAEALPLLKRWVWGGKLVLVIQFFLALLLIFVFDGRVVSMYYFIGVLFSVSMLVLVEQLLRNYNQAQRWQVKFFCIACVLMFGFDFLLYSQSVLKGQIQPSWLQARGAVMTLATPLVFLYATRHRRVPRLTGFSHKLIFHTSVLLAASGYLILTAMAGYYFKNFGGGWGDFLRILVVAVALLGLALLLFSGTMRARLWVFVSRHILPFQYDYREEWLKVTGSLSEATELWSLARKIVSLLGDCVESTGGAIWVCNESQRLVLISNSAFHFPDVHTSRDLDSLVRFWETEDCIVLIPDLFNDAALAKQVLLPDWLVAEGLGWLLIPLKTQNTLQGFVLLAQPRTEITLNWENFDYLRVVASQAAVQLAVVRASKQLAITQRFEAVHQMSAFFVHDLKTMVSQLSMMSKNAHRHIANPAFIEDMLSTIDHAVSKMQRILKHLQSADVNQRFEHVDVVVLLREVIGSVNGEPKPELMTSVESFLVRAERSALRSALLNLIVNAQEAVRENQANRDHSAAREAPAPAVRITVTRFQNNNVKGVQTTDQLVQGGQIIPSDQTSELAVALESVDQYLITIEDTGKGMSPEFMREHLFKPFHSTKGLTGMGIGLYQTKASLEMIGAEVFVESHLGEGTTFRILMPAVAENDEAINETPMGDTSRHSTLE